MSCWSVRAAQLAPTDSLGQTDVGGMDAESIHQVEDLDLGVDRRVDDRWRLQAIAQSFVVELDRLGRPNQVARLAVPVVDQLGDL
jgi:hypothetical protein